MKFSQRQRRNGCLVLALTWTFLANSVPASAEPERPVFIVPGILGSVLKQHNQIVWGDLRSLNPDRFGKLDLLPAEGEPPRLAPSTALKNIPLLFGLFEYSVYDRLIEFLEKKGGYKERKDLFVFAYDWRRTNFATAKRLNDFITAHAPTGEYDLIAHSMGGLVTRIMLDGRAPDWICTGAASDATDLGPVSEEDRNLLCNTLYGPDSPLSWPNTEFSGPYEAASRLHTFIEMGVPHLGSVNVVKTYLEGWGALSRKLGTRTIQTVLLSMSAPIELAPVYEDCCWRGESGAQRNWPLKELSDRLDYSSWSRDVLGFGRNPCPYPHCDLRRRMLAAGLSARATIDDIVTTGVLSTIKDHYVIVGRDVENTYEAYYLPKSNSGDGTRITYFRTSDGDGTVSRLSAMALEKKTPVHHIAAVRTSHALIYSDPGVLQQLTWIVLNPLDARIKARNEEPLEVAGTSIQTIGIEVEPQIALPGDEITITLSMTAPGGDSFSEEEFDKAAIRAALINVATDAVGSTATLELDTTASLLNSGEAVLRGRLIAPQGPSVYRIDVAAQTGRVIRQSQLHVISNE